MHRYLALALLAACHPRPLARPDLAALGRKVLLSLRTSGPYVPPAVVTEEAPPEQAPPEQAPPPTEEAPPEAPRPRRHAKPAPAPPRPTIPTTTTTVTRPAAKAVFAAHAQTKGGANSCTAHPTMAECTSHCTSVLRASSMDRSPGAIRSCNCVEAGC